MLNIFDNITVYNSWKTVPLAPTLEETELAALECLENDFLSKGGSKIWL